ncbi:MAG: tryptophan--tRNA ligase, partial [Acidimicrobiales bacterium]
LSNLIELLGASSDRSIEDVTASYGTYGELKEDLAEALVELLAPLRSRYEQFAVDQGAVAELLAKGAEKAQSVASATLRRAEHAIGLLQSLG